MTGDVRRRGARSWELKWDAGTDAISGRRQTKYRNFKGTRRDAEIELARLVSETADGNYIDPSKLTLCEFLDRWERDWATSNLSPKTLERYRELDRLHVRPHLGAARLQKLKPVHFAELYARLQRDTRAKVQPNGSTITMPPLSPRTVGHVHRLLHRVFGHAVTWGLLTTNPTDAIKPPPVEGLEIEILTEDQVGIVLQKLRGRNAPGARLLYRIIIVMLASGVRRGEVLALRWKDVDLEAGRIRVEQSLEQTKAGLRFKPPKTKHGRRHRTAPPSSPSYAPLEAGAGSAAALGLGKGPGRNWSSPHRRRAALPEYTTTEWFARWRP